MIFSIQILDFNENNCSESFMKEMIPNEQDKQTFFNFHNRHEEYLEDENEDNDMFSVFQLSFDDFQNYSNTKVDIETYNKINSDCNLFGCVDSFALNSTNKRSFDFLLNMFDEFEDNFLQVDFIDDDFSELDIDEVKEMIEEKQQNSKPVVFSYILYDL